jgi:hypothetical protein
VAANSHEKVFYVHFILQAALLVAPNIGNKKP